MNKLVKNISVYDCFILFDELDLLELRLHTLSKVVDFFVLVEATRTFSGRTKELYYLKNKERYSEFNERIIHIVVDDMPEDVERWEREFHQRDAIMRGLRGCSPNDIIIISDVDEIPKPDVIKNYTTEDPLTLKMRVFYYYLNCESERQEEASVIVRYKRLKTPQSLRNNRNSFAKIEDAGWHFSYLGGIKKIRKKIESFSHSEYDRESYKDPVKLFYKIKGAKDLFDRDISYRFVKIDETFPEYLLDNIQRYSKYIIEPNREINNQAVKEDGYMIKNLEILRNRNPELAEVLTFEDDKGYRVIFSRSGKPTIKYHGITLHSQYDPESEAKRWVKTNRDRLDEGKTICVFGFGLGYHIEELVKYTDKEIVVFEADIDMIKTALKHRDLRAVLSRIRLICGEDVSDINSNYTIVKYLPSIKINEGFYDRIERRLIAKKIANRCLKISVIGPIYGGSLPIAEYTARALKKLGHKVQYIDNSPFKEAFLFIYDAHLDQNIKKNLHEDFIKLTSKSVLAHIEKFKPDLVIALAQAPINNELLSELKKINLKTAFWFVENYRHLTYWQDAFRYYDYVFVIQKGEFIDSARRVYKKCFHYLPLAALPEFHRPVELTAEEREEFGSDVSFVGAGYKNRREFLTGLLDYDFKIWGNEWDMMSPLKRVIQREGARVEPEEIVKIFNATKININLHSSAVHSGLDPFGDFVNPRTFEIPACSGFQLVDMRSPIKEFFEIGKEIETYESIDELRKKISYYLKHPDERCEIAESGYNRVLKNHTYELRMKEMIEVIIKNDFELPKWTQDELFIDDLVSEAKDDRELSEFFKGLEAKYSRVKIDDIVSSIQQMEGKKELNTVEKAFLYMMTVKKQYIKEQA